MNAWQEERKNNLFILLAALVLITIPLPYIFNSIAVVVFIIFTLLKGKTLKFNSQRVLIYPIALYLLMALSILWTIDFKITFEALSKELSLLLIPFCFFIMQFNKVEKFKILSYFSHAIFGYCVFYLIKSVIRYFLTNDVSVFFYHELVTLDVNAIHVSVYCVVSFFYFLTKDNKTTFDKIALIILTLVTILLSSKNIIITFIFLLLIYAFYHRKKELCLYFSGTFSCNSHCIFQ
jgi:O-antigen ligase